MVISFRDFVCALNETTFSTFMWIVRNGPVWIEDVRDLDAVSDLERAGFVVMFDDRDKVGFVATIEGERAIEGIRRIYDEWFA